LRIASEIGIAGRVCEIGVAGGGSLEMWQSLFPHGIVVGVDNKSYADGGLLVKIVLGEAPAYSGIYWPDGTVRVVAEQDDPTLPDKLKETASEFDLIVDDASHDGELTKRTWELLWPMVAPGRWYVVEDWMEVSMHPTIVSFLWKLLDKESDVESIEYRYGMAILKKRRL